MSTNIISTLASAIENAKAQLAEQEKMIAILRNAGEDTIRLQAELANTRAKIEKWARAISEASSV